MFNIEERLAAVDVDSTVVLLPHVEVREDIGVITSRLDPGLRMQIDPGYRSLLNQARRNVRFHSFDGGDEVARALIDGIQRGLFTIRPVRNPEKKSGAEKWLVLSPHPDDAALSIGGCLARDCGQVDIVLATLVSTFRHSSADAVRGNQKVVTRLRHQEEELVCSFYGARKVDGGLLDADIRDELSDEDKPGTIFRAATDAEVEMYVGTLDRIFREAMPDRVYVPMGVGSHVDHNATHRAALALLPEWRAINPALRVLIFEDLPYACNDYLGVLMASERLKKSHGATALFEDIGDALEDKLWAIAVYQSQIWRAFQHNVVRYAEHVGIETGDRPPGFLERLWEIP